MIELITENQGVIIAVFSTILFLCWVVCDFKEADENGYLVGEE